MSLVIHFICFHILKILKSANKVKPTPFLVLKYIYTSTFLAFHGKIQNKKKLAGSKPKSKEEKY